MTRMAKGVSGSGGTSGWCWPLSCVTCWRTASGLIPSRFSAWAAMPCSVPASASRNCSGPGWPRPSRSASARARTTTSPASSVKGMNPVTGVRTPARGLGSTARNNRRPARSVRMGASRAGGAEYGDSRGRSQAAASAGLSRPEARPSTTTSAVRGGSRSARQPFRARNCTVAATATCRCWQGNGRWRSRARISPAAPAAAAAQSSGAARSSDAPVRGSAACGSAACAPSASAASVRAAWAAAMSSWSSAASGPTPRTCPAITTRSATSIAIMAGLPGAGRAGAGAGPGCPPAGGGTAGPCGVPRPRR